MEYCSFMHIIITWWGDLVPYVVLSKPPPTCICNHSGEEPLLGSLVACETNGMPARSNVCWPYWKERKKLGLVSPMFFIQWWIIKKLNHFNPFFFFFRILSIKYIYPLQLKIELWINLRAESSILSPIMQRPEVASFLN